MTLIQEAYTLMQKQPESNLKILVDLLHSMSPVSTETLQGSAVPYKRTGVANGTAVFPMDFDESFDAFDPEIEALFTGDL